MFIICNRECDGISTFHRIGMAGLNPGTLTAVSEVPGIGCNLAVRVIGGGSIEANQERGITRSGGGGKSCHRVACDLTRLDIENIPLSSHADVAVDYMNLPLAVDI